MNTDGQVCGWAERKTDRQVCGWAERKTGGQVCVCPRLGRQVGRWQEGTPSKWRGKERRPVHARLVSSRPEISQLHVCHVQGPMGL